MAKKPKTKEPDVPVPDAVTPRRKKKPAEAAPAEVEVAPAESALPESLDGAEPRKGKGRKKKKDADAASDASNPPENSTAVETPAAEAPPEADLSPEEPGLNQLAEVAAAEQLETAAVAAETGELAAAAPVVTEINWDELARTVEALLFAAEEPLQTRELARCSGTDSPTIRKLIPKIRERYDAERRPWDIAETGTGWRLVTRPEFYPAIQRLKTQTLQRKLTQAGLETLALIAYRQPISRAEIENVRGVGAGPVLRLLLERRLIKIAGRGTGLGQPLLYGTTDFFLEHFGLKSLNDLPKPGEFKQ